MEAKKIDKGAPSLKPHGDVLKVPEGSGRPPGDPLGPAQPGSPTPQPETPDVPGPTEPAEPDQGQPIPPELNTDTPHL